MNKNDVIEDINNYRHTLTKEISRGGQGAVYRTLNPNIAVKLVFDRQNMDYSKDISENAKYDFLRMLPLPKNSNITLPQVTLLKYAGYTMTLLDDMKSFESVFAYDFNFETDYTNAWIDSLRSSSEECAKDFTQYIVTGGIRRRLEAYYKCAEILAMLHSNGLVYCDLSANNIFISEETSKAVWLIDADNINYQKYTLKNGGYYTPGYAAPEVIKGKGSSFYSDCYSFAISLFWNLTWNHPFIGAMLDEGFDDDFADNRQDKAYSGEYPWIMDNEDDSNHLGDSAKGMPIKMVVGPKLMKYFDRTFCTDGKTKRMTRPTMYEWANALAEEIDFTIRCPKCHMDYNAHDSKVCPWCDNEPITVNLTSYRQGKIFWSYVHEVIDDEEISIPLRIIESAKSSNVDKSLFSMKKEDKGYVIYDMNEEYEFRIETEKQGSFSAYGEVVISQKCSIKATHIRTHSEVIIEVEVV